MREAHFHIKKICQDSKLSLTRDLIHRPIQATGPLAGRPDAARRLHSRDLLLWEMLSLMLAGLARVIGRGGATAFSRCDHIIAIFLIAKNQH